jgi:hypothetical protein
MNSDWTLIVRGFTIATLGAVASMLYIVGVSAAYVGRSGVSGATLAAAVLLALLFHRTLSPYLDALDRRTSEGDASDADLTQPETPSSNPPYRKPSP